MPFIVVVAAVVAVVAIA